MQDDVLGVHAPLAAARDLDPARPRSLERETLARQYVAHLTRADAEGGRTEGPVRAGMTVATGNRHPRPGERHLGPDDMHDALVAGVGAEELNLVLATVALDRRHHDLGLGVAQRAGLGVGGDDMIDGRDGAFGEGHRETGLAQHGESLRTGHLMDEVEPDEELGLARGQLAHRVRVPDLVEKGLAHDVMG